MKTKINITNYITKGLILAITAVSLMINASGQKTQEFVNSEKYAFAQILAAEINADNAKTVVSAPSSNSAKFEMSVEEFLKKAAGISSGSVNMEMETSEETATDENNNLEHFLYSAASLNQVEPSFAIENISGSDSELENFLIHAASLYSVQDVNIGSTDSETEALDGDVTDFLIKAAGLNISNCLTMN